MAREARLDYRRRNDEERKLQRFQDANVFDHLRRDKLRRVFSSFREAEPMFLRSGKQLLFFPFPFRFDFSSFSTTTGRDLRGRNIYRTSTRLYAILKFNARFRCDEPFSFAVSPKRRHDLRPRRNLTKRKTATTQLGKTRLFPILAIRSKRSDKQRIPFVRFHSILDERIIEFTIRSIPWPALFLAGENSNFVRDAVISGNIWPDSFLRSIRSGRNDESFARITAIRDSRDQRIIN